MGRRALRHNKKGRLAATFAMGIQTNGTCKVTSLASVKIGQRGRWGV